MYKLYHEHQESVMHPSPLSRKIFLLLFFCLCFAAGHLAARSGTDISPVLSQWKPQVDNWGLSFQEEGRRPVGNATISELLPWHAYYAQDTDEKIIYLTFDCGYENGNTPAILDALKKHQVSATFFAVGTFLESQPDLIRRMVAEGHSVGNHTWHHPDMSAISTPESFSEELDRTADAYRQITGQDMPRYYRPPQGKYSEENLKMAKALGYKTVFWSLAYADWDINRQPGRDYVHEAVTKYIHNGAVILMHAVSADNAAELPSIIDDVRKMGYEFNSLDKLK